MRNIVALAGMAARALYIYRRIAQLAFCRDEHIAFFITIYPPKFIFDLLRSHWEALEATSPSGRRG